jgi:hypothetical protein
MNQPKLLGEGNVCKCDRDSENGVISAASDGDYGWSRLAWNGRPDRNSWPEEDETEEYESEDKLDR